MKVFKLCQSYLEKHKYQLFLFGIFAVIIQILAFITPYILGNFMDGLVASMNMEFVLNYCILYVVITITSLLFQFLVSLFYCKLQTIMGYELNRDVLFYIQDLPISFLSGKGLSQLNRQINDDSNALIIFCLNIFNQFSINFLSLPILIFISFYLNKTVTILYMFYCIAYILIFHLIKKLRYKISYKLLDDRSKFFGKLFEQLEYIDFIKSHGIEKYFRKKMESPFNELYKSSVTNQKFEYILATVDNLLSMAAQVTLFFIGAKQVFNGTFTIGNFFIFFNYFAMIKGCINYFYNFGAYYQQTLVAYDRTIAILSENKEINGKTLLSDIKKITIKNLNLTFDDEHKIFDSFSMQFVRGKIYGISGKNGLGKTTLVKVIIGLLNEKIQNNTVFLDDVDIKNVDKNILRHECIAYIEQNALLMDENILNNIVLDRTYDDLNVIHYLSSIVNIEALIFEKNNKQSSINNLSGGERQKISILRALFKNSSVIILDEPTSALDYESAKNLMKYLQKIKNSKIIIIISHDDNIIKACDSLVPLDKSPN